jgi:MtN3 and saliva related transmembrane protein
MLLTLLAWLTTLMGVLMSAGHFAQARRILQRKSSKDVSLTTYTIFMVGSWTWLAYGAALKSVPIIASFGIAVVGTTFVVILILKYR